MATRACRVSRSLTRIIDDCAVWRIVIGAKPARTRSLRGEISQPQWHDILRPGTLPVLPPQSGNPPELEAIVGDDREVASKRNSGDLEIVRSDALPGSL